MTELSNLIFVDKKRLLDFVGDFENDEYYAWSRRVLDILVKKSMTMDNPCIVGKIVSAINNLFYYFKYFRDDEDCLHYLMISLYMIGLEVGCLQFGDVIEKYEFFYEVIDENDWKHNVQGSLSDLIVFDILTNQELLEEWKDGEPIGMRPLGLQSASSVSIYLGYSY